MAEFSNISRPSSETVDGDDKSSTTAWNRIMPVPSTSDAEGNNHEQSSCPVCGSMFANPIACLVHCQAVHAAPSQTFDCSICGASQSDIRAYFIHIKMHHDHQADDPSQHRHDNLQQTSQEQITVGQSQQNSEISSSCCGDPCEGQLRSMKMRQEFPCRACTAVFPNLRALKGHNRDHCNEPPFVCNVADCLYSTSDRATLIRHMRLHTGEKPFTCQICSFGFTTKANCERHIKNKHGRSNRSEVRDAVMIHESASSIATTSDNNRDEDDEELEIALQESAIMSANKNVAGKSSETEESGSAKSGQSSTRTYSSLFAPYEHNMFRKLNEASSSRGGKPSQGNASSGANSAPSSDANSATSSGANSAPSNGANSASSSGAAEKLEANPEGREGEPSAAEQQLDTSLNSSSTRGTGTSLETPLDLSAGPLDEGGQLPDLQSLPNQMTPAMTAYYMMVFSELLRRQQQTGEAGQLSASSEALLCTPPLSDSSSQADKLAASTLLSAAAITTVPVQQPLESPSAPGQAADAIEYKIVMKDGVLVKRPKQRRYRTEKPYSCRRCEAKFTLRSNMERHIKHQHGGERGGDSSYIDADGVHRRQRGRKKMSSSETGELAPPASDTGDVDGDAHITFGKELLAKLAILHQIKFNQAASNTGAMMTASSGNGEEEQSGEACELVDVKSVDDDKVDCRQPDQSETTTELEPVSPAASDTVHPFKCHICDDNFICQAEALEHLKLVHAVQYALLVERGAIGVGASGQLSPCSSGSSPLSASSGVSPSGGSIASDDDNISQVDHTDGGANVAANQQRKVRCLFCLGKFWSAEDLRRHVRTHTGERPYSCDVCARRFTLKHSMLRHRRKHDSGFGRDLASHSSNSLSSPPSDGGPDVSLRANQRRRESRMDSTSTVMSDDETRAAAAAYVPQLQKVHAANTAAAALITAIQRSFAEQQSTAQ